MKRVTSFFHELRGQSERRWEIDVSVYSLYSGISRSDGVNPWLILKRALFPYKGFQGWRVLCMEGFSTGAGSVFLQLLAVRLL